MREEELEDETVVKRPRQKLWKQTWALEDGMGGRPENNFTAKMKLVIFAVKADFRALSTMLRRGEKRC